MDIGDRTIGNQKFILVESFVRNLNMSTRNQGSAGGSREKSVAEQHTVACLSGKSAVNMMSKSGNCPADLSVRRMLCRIQAENFYKVRGLCSCSAAANKIKDATILHKSVRIAVKKKESLPI
jgi:hypothetical protein